MRGRTATVSPVLPIAPRSARPRSIARLAALASVAALASAVAAASVAIVAGPSMVGTVLAATRVPAYVVPPLGPLPKLTSGGPVSGSITFYGRGYGHGVGMSQYGARGRALAGQPANVILAHYYAGTSWSTVNPATTVRVLLLQGFAPTAAAPLILHGRTGTWSVDGLSGIWPADARLTVAPTTVGGIATWRLTVTSSIGTTLGTGTTCCSVRVRPQQSSTRLEVDSKASTDDTYRGVIHLSGSATSVSVVNEVGLDLYLRGVVPCEMPATWPTQALRAQAIAARSFAVAHLHPASGAWDLHDDTRSQVYRGVKAERSATTVVVDADAGVVLVSGSAVIDALYHSAGGGATEDNEYAFPTSSGSVVGSPVSYLRGSSDRMPDGTPYDAASPYASWHSATYTIAQLSSYLARDARTNVGTITSIDLSHRGVSGRLYRVTLTGTLGTKSVSGDVFRSVFNTYTPSTDPGLMSNLFDLAPIG